MAESSRKRVRFSDAQNALDPKYQQATSSRDTILPKPDKGEEGLEGTTEEDGTIKSTNPEFAAAFRARHRKEIEDLKASHLEYSFPEGICVQRQIIYAVGEAVDISLLEDVALAEEEDDDDVELRFTDDGIPIEPFNLRAERAHGYFDADGNYVAYRGDDTDAWLETLPEGQISSGRVQERTASGSKSADDNMEQRPEMTNDEKDDYRQRVIQALQPGETVLDALRRLGTPQDAAAEAHSQQQSATKAQRLAAVRSKLAGTVPERNRAAFDRLTEAASQLLNAGDTGIYSTTREQLVSTADAHQREADRRGGGGSMTMRSRVSAEAAALTSRLAAPLSTDMEVDDAKDSDNAPADDGGDMFAEEPWGSKSETRT